MLFDIHSGCFGRFIRLVTSIKCLPIILVLSIILAILGSDSPYSNNTPFIPREKPNVKHSFGGSLRPYHGQHLSPHSCGGCIGTAAERRNQGTPQAIRPNIIARHVQAAAPLG